MSFNIRNTCSKLKSKLNSQQFCRNISKASSKKLPPGKIIDLGSHKIHYELLGHGKHNVALVPALMGTGRMDWKAQLYTLDQNKFTILTWDPPAFGYSSPPDYLNHVDGFHKDTEVAERLLKALGFTQISLVGWCSGSVHSMMIAEHQLHIVDKLVLSNPFYRLYDEQLKIWEDNNDINKWSPYMKDDVIEIHGAEYVQEKLNIVLKSFREMESIDQGHLCRKEMENIKCPTLIIGCKNDNWVIPETSRQLSKIIRHSKYVEFDDGKHYPHMIYPQQFNKIIEDFLLE